MRQFKTYDAKNFYRKHGSGGQKPHGNRYGAGSCGQRLLKPRTTEEAGVSKIATGKVHSLDDLLTSPLTTSYLRGEFKNKSALSQAIVAHQGYDGKPTVASADEFKKLVDAGAEEHLRGVSADTQAESESYAEAFRTGDYYVGKGYSGNGTYAAFRAGSEEIVEAYRTMDGAKEGTIFRLLTKPGGKDTTFDALKAEQETFHDDLYQKIDKLERNNARTAGENTLLDTYNAALKMTFDVGNLRGYDSYTGMGVGNAQERIFVNRTRVIVAEK